MSTPPGPLWKNLRYIRYEVGDVTSLVIAHGVVGDIQAGAAEKLQSVIIDVA